MLERILNCKNMNFVYNKNIITTQDELLVSVADLRDLVQAFTIGNDAQKIQELKIILDSIVRKNRLLPGAVDVIGSN